MKIKDKISVVIVTYNEKEYLLRQQLDSLINQTYGNLEIIVVDDGCTDNTPEVLNEYSKQDKRVKVYRRERTSSFRSVSEAFNVGLEHVTGDWWRHDASDNYHTLDWAERCVIALQDRDDVIGCHTDFVIHNYDGSTKPYNIKKTWNKDFSSFENYRRYEALGGTLFRMDCVKKSGLWDTRFPRKQTREWTLRVLQHGNLVHIPVEAWHFIFHEIDQMKNIASIKYRLLCDLKNGFDVSHNIQAALKTKNGRLSMIDAFRDFLTKPEWEHERKYGVYGKDLNMIKALADKEASEDWEG